jgi:D-glycero-D-manno-heptose 1,7-bisphosphate phosphatase
MENEMYTESVRMNKAVFLDKDGTLVKDVPYNVDETLIEYEEDVIDSLVQFREHGFLLIMISNQSGVARGYFAEDALQKVSVKIQADLGMRGVSFEAFYFCPHHPEGSIEKYSCECQCRKPRPGMILKAAEDFKVDLSKSWMVGDILNDVEAGNRAGCGTILINNGNETEWLKGEFREPSFEVANMKEAAEIILSTQLIIR